MFSILYGCGLRKAEVLRLRVKDIDFESNSIFVFRGKGGKDRMTMLPISLIDLLKAQVSLVADIHKKDLAEGEGKIEHSKQIKYFLMITSGFVFQ